MLLNSALETEINCNVITRQYDLEEKFTALPVPVVLLIINLFASQKKQQQMAWDA